MAMNSSMLPIQTPKLDIIRRFGACESCDLKKTRKNHTPQIDPTRSHLLKTSSRAPCVCMWSIQVIVRYGLKDAGISQILSKVPPFFWRTYSHESPRYPECFLDKTYPGVFSWHPGNARFQGTFWFTTQRFHYIRLGHPVVGSRSQDIPWGSILLGKFQVVQPTPFKGGLFLATMIFVSYPRGWMWVDGNPRKKSGRNRNPLKNPFLVAYSCLQSLYSIYNIMNNGVV